MTNIADNPFAPTQPVEPTNTNIQTNPFLQADSENTPEPTNTEFVQQPSPQYPDGSVNVQNQSFSTQQIPSENAGIMPAGGQIMNNPNFPVQAPGFTAPNTGFAAPVQNPGFTAPNTGFAAPVQNPGFAAPVQNPGFAAPNTGFAAPVQAPGFTAPNTGFAAPVQNPGFAAPVQNPAFPAPAMPMTNGHPTQENPKYSIIDMFWLINRKIFKNEQFMDGEASFLSVGFNANFNNLRVSFYVLNQQDLQGTSLIMQNMRKITTINLYSETAGELFFNKGNGNAVRLYERVIRPGNWAPNLSQITWLSDKIVIQTQDTQGTLTCFTLLDWHIQAFEAALNFMVDGNSWKASLSKL